MILLWAHTTYRLSCGAPREGWQCVLGPWKIEKEMGIGREPVRPSLAWTTPFTTSLAALADACWKTVPKRDRCAPWGLEGRSGGGICSSCLKGFSYSEPKSACLYSPSFISVTVRRVTKHVALCTRVLQMAERAGLCLPGPLLPASRW